VKNVGRDRIRNDDIKNRGRTKYNWKSEKGKIGVFKENNGNGKA
jgi:hypothetical protein